jgi:hypothetical protein
LLVLLVLLVEAIALGAGRFLEAAIVAVTVLLRLLNTLDSFRTLVIIAKAGAVPCAPYSLSEAANL